MSIIKRDNLKYSMSKTIRPGVLCVLIILVVAGRVGAMVRIRDIARPLGERSNKLIGDGIVVGLKGTGDGGDALIASRPFREMLQRMDNPVELEDLNDAKNFAYVMVTAELGRGGVRSGDKIDVYVHSMGKAKSLEGGTLLIAPLLGSHYADDHLYGWAQGPVTITDPEIPTSGVIKAGADIEEDFFHQYIERDPETGESFITLVLDEDHASWLAAKVIADNINEETAAPDADINSLADGNSSFEAVAVALDTKNIRVNLSAKQARLPSSFVARIMNLQIDLPDPEATVVVNERTGVIVITGNVEISPVMVTVDGLSIRVINPEPEPMPNRPVVSETQWAKINISERKGIAIDQLIDALDQLNVSVQQKINAIYEISRAGALHARIKTEY